jgi:hypothetical protein
MSLSLWNYGNLLSRIFNEVFVVAYDGSISCCSSFLPKIEEVPNVKTLANVMNAEYSRNQNGAIIRTTIDQISNYFDMVEGDDK